MLPTTVVKCPLSYNDNVELTIDDWNNVGFSSTLRIGALDIKLKVRIEDNEIVLTLEDIKTDCSKCKLKSDECKYACALYMLLLR